MCPPRPRPPRALRSRPARSAGPSPAAGPDGPPDELQAGHVPSWQQGEAGDGAW